jgi:hypothetical protein
LLTLAVVGLLVVGLAACGGGGGSSTGSTSASGGKEPRASFRTRSGDNSIPNFGAEAGASERRQAEAALGAYLGARAKGDWAAACSGLADSVRKQVRAFVGASSRPTDCASLYAVLGGSSPPAARADTLTHGVASLRVKGESAFALFVGPHAQKYVMPMAREGGVWRVTQIAPIEYPLGASTGGD